MSDVLLVTCARLPDGEPGGAALVEAFAARGHRARWVCWDDPDVDWAAADLVAVRSTWDYEHRRAEFLAWARGVPRVLHGADVFAANIDKSYLVALAAAGVPVVPTVIVESEEDLPQAVAAHGRAVVKPVVGAGGRGVVVLPADDDGATDVDLAPGPWVVQPLVESVRTEGEHSVFVLGGAPVAQVRKLPAGGSSGGEIRVHATYGGSSTVVPLDPATADLARATVATAERVLGGALVYARVDLLRLVDGSWAVGEVEVTEPGLYLDVLPANAAAFVDAVLAGEAGAAP